MLPQRTLLLRHEDEGERNSKGLEVNMVEGDGHLNITFSRDGVELAPRVVIENLGGRANLIVWDDKKMPYSHRTEICSPIEKSPESPEHIDAEDVSEMTPV